MKIVNISLTGTITKGYMYQDNLLPKYQKILGNEVCVITNLYFNDDKGVKHKVSDDVFIDYDRGVKIIRIPNKFGTTIKSKFKKYINFIPILEQENPDIIFLHGLQFIDSMQVLRYVKKHRNVTLYVDNHADLENSAHSWISKNILHGIVWRSYAKKLNPYVKKFYGVTPARVLFLTSMYMLPKEKCELLVMGVDDETVNAIDIESERKRKRKSYGLMEDDFVLVTGGKINLNRPETIRLMKVVNGLKDSKIKLLIFGSVADSLRNSFNVELTDKVKFVGWKSSCEIFKEFACGDLVVFPGLHSVLWEQAVGMGMPCLFRKIKGFEHINLGGNCEFLDEMTDESIASKILICKNNIKTMRENAQIKKACFSYKEIAKRSVEI